MQITENARLQHETRDDAERMIEIRCPAGYFYEVSEIRTGLAQIPISFAVKVYAGGDDDRPSQFLGYAYDPEAETGFLAAVEGLQ